MLIFSAGALGGILTDIATTLGHLHNLHTFVAAVEKGPRPNRPPPSRTAEAYAGGIANILAVFSEYLLQLEEQLAAQQTTTCTLIGLLLANEMAAWRRQFSYLHQLHQLAVLPGGETTDAPNWLAAVRILSVLYSALVGALFPDLLTWLLDLFLRSVRPYFRQENPLELLKITAFRIWIIKS